MPTLKFNCSISWLETVITSLYMFVSPICAFQYWTKKSVNTNVLEITLESSVVECKEMTALLACIAKAEKSQILLAANIYCIWKAEFCTTILKSSPGTTWACSGRLLGVIACRVKSPWDMSAVPSFFFLSHKLWLFDDILLDKEEKKKIPGFFFTLFYFDSISTWNPRPLTCLLVNKQSSYNSFDKKVALSPFLPWLSVLQADKLITEANENIRVSFQIRAFVWRLRGRRSCRGVSRPAVGNEAAVLGCSASAFWWERLWQASGPIRNWRKHFTVGDTSLLYRLWRY